MNARGSTAKAPTTRLGSLALLVVVLSAWFPAPAGAVTPGVIRPVPCLEDLTGYDVVIDCLAMTVPLDHDDPDRGDIEVGVVRIHSRSAGPAPDPVVYLEGGPGGAPSPFLWSFVESPILASRDLILVDQRGTGSSWPNLSCHETSDSEGATADEYLEALAACHERLLVTGADPAEFTTPAAAHDLEALRQAMGVDTWNLYGISYGTRLALTTMRLHPEGIRSVVLDSVFPPDVDGMSTTPELADRALAALDAACHADGVCDDPEGRLTERVARITERLSSEPIEVEVPWLDGSGQVYLDVVDGDWFAAAVQAALYDPTLIPILPHVIERIDAGDERVLATLVALAAGDPVGSSDGLYLSVMCHDEVPFEDPAAIEAAFLADPGLFGGVSPIDECAIWAGEPSDAAEAEAVTSDVPALLLSSPVDPATPAEWAERAAAGLSRSTVVEIPTGGHGVSTTVCGSRVMVAFLDDPLRAPDAGCSEEGIDFEANPVPIVGSRFDGLTDEAPWLLLLVAGWSLAALVGVGMWFARTRIGGGAHHVAWMLATAVLAAFGPAAALLTYTAVWLSPSFATYFALPGWMWPVFLLPYVALVLLAAATTLTIVSVARRSTPAWAAVVYAALGGALTVVVVAYGGAGLIPLPW
jgi:pimeloyl-ACP methyl ester carboxylesterase